MWQIIPTESSVKSSKPLQCGLDAFLCRMGGVCGTHHKVLLQMMGCTHPTTTAEEQICTFKGKVSKRSGSFKIRGNYMKRVLLLTMLCLIVFFVQFAVAEEPGGYTTKQATDEPTTDINSKAVGEKAAKSSDNATRLLERLKELQNEDSKLNKTWEQISGSKFQNNTGIAAMGQGLNHIKKSIDEIEDQAEKVHGSAAETKRLIDKAKDPGYKTKYFLLTAGAVTLNPYKIVKENNDFKLASTGETDVHYFVEALFKFRRAWLGEEAICNEYHKCWGGEIKFGLTDTNNNQETSVASGTGDTCIELNAGPDFSINKSSKDNLYMRLGVPDFIYGFSTDRENQTIHEYWGAGLLLTFRAPTSEKRFIEGDTGLYYGAIDMPEFKDDNSTILNKRRDTFPKFKPVNTGILKAEARLPVGESGFVTIAGRFHRFIDGQNDLPNPWTLTLGYTIPIDVILEGVISIPRAVVKQ